MVSHLVIRADATHNYNKTGRACNVFAVIEATLDQPPVCRCISQLTPSGPDVCYPREHRISHTQHNSCSAAARLPLSRCFRASTIWLNPLITRHNPTQAPTRLSHVTAI